MALPAAAPAKKNDVDTVMRGMLSQVEMAAPKHLDSDRLIRLALTSIKKNKDLMQCFQNNPSSVLASFMESVQLGLEIDTRGLAYLIPYKGSCTFQVGYKGLISLAMRSGKLRNIYAEVVYESEQNNVHIDLGLSRNLTHNFDFKIAREGKLILAYAVAVFLDGSTHFEYVQPHHIEKAKKTSMGAGSQYSPWNTHTEEMWKKTAIKKLCKYLDLSPELAEAIAKEDEAEAVRPQPERTASVISMASIGSDMGMYQTAAPAIDVSPTPEPEDSGQPDMAAIIEDQNNYNKAMIRINELVEENKEVVRQYMSGRNPETMTADELWDVVRAVEGAI